MDLKLQVYVYSIRNGVDVINGKSAYFRHTSHLDIVARCTDGDTCKLYID